MKLPTHGLVGYGLAHLLGWRGIRCRYVIAGAVAPDGPVMIAGMVAAFRSVLESGSLAFAPFKAHMDQLYFSGPLLPCHNLLHSPLSLGLLAALAIFLLDAERRSFALAFLAGAASHAALDILTHVEDGPLLFWPLDWETRLAGPLSHWDASHGGLAVTAGECCAWIGSLLAVSRRPLPGLPCSWLPRLGDRHPRLADA